MLLNRAARTLPSSSRSLLVAPRSPRAHAAAGRRASTTPARASLLTWADVQQQTSSDGEGLGLAGFAILPGSKPSTAPTATLPTLPDAHKTSTKPLVFFRDTNAWCPYCARVWLALEEKGIPYDCVLIDLGNKPAWYVDLVPTTKVPALFIAETGQVVWESKDILLALEERFPGQAPLLPQDPGLREQAHGMLQELEAHDFGGAGYKFMAAGASLFGPGEPDETQLPALQAAFERELSWLEGALGREEGAYLLGQSFSLLDAMAISSLERLAACLPVFRGFKVADNPAYPNIAAWFAALHRQPAYQKVRTDAATLVRLFSKSGKMQPLAGPEPAPGAGVAAARREAAGKIQRNREAIVEDIVKGTGLLSLCAAAPAVDGGAQPSLGPSAVREAVDLHLRRLAAQLLCGGAGPRAQDPAAAAVGAAALAFFRNRASSPRDLSASACEELRAACDAVLRDIF